MYVRRCTMPCTTMPADALYKILTTTRFQRLPAALQVGARRRPDQSFDVQDIFVPPMYDVLRSTDKSDHGRHVMYYQHHTIQKDRQQLAVTGPAPAPLPRSGTSGMYKRCTKICTSPSVRCRRSGPAGRCKCRRSMYCSTGIDNQTTTSFVTIAIYLLKNHLLLFILFSISEMSPTTADTT